MDLAEWIVLFSIFVKTLAEKNFTGCLKMNTYGYPYLQKFNIDELQTDFQGRPGEIYLQFYVKASQNAHIRLTPSENDENGYEIVLGGGNNSFSQIRLIQKNIKKAKATTTTLNILSVAEDRGFWIKFSTLGTLTVGHIDETAGFLHWYHSNPYEIQFISFSTWTNIRGEWHFACSSHKYSTGDAGDVTAVRRLYTQLFSYYNPNNIPIKDGHQNQTIELHLQVNHFSMDEKRAELLTTGITYLKWTDWKLQWNATDYENIYTIYTTPHKIWTPNVYVLNSIELQKKSLLSKDGGVTVRHDGEVTWRTSFRSVTFCLLDYKKWPFEGHNCSLLFGFLTEPIKINIQELVLSKISVSQWTIHSVERTTSNTIANQKSIIYIYFKRRNPFLIEVLIFPTFICAALLSFLSFWINPNSLAKIFLSCGSIFILTLTLITLGDIIPVMVSPAPALVNVYLFGLVAMYIPLLLFIGLKYISWNITLPRFFIAMLDSRIAEILCCLPEKSISTENKSLRQMNERNNDALRLAVFIERLFFLIYFIAIVTPFFLVRKFF